MLTKVDVRYIFRDHWSTLRDYSTERISSGDIILFAVIPAALACASALHEVVVSANAASVITTAMAVFAGLLFNLLLLAHGIIRRAERAARFKEESQLLREIFANISYAILISLFSIVVLIFSFLPSPRWLNITTSALSVALIANFMLTLLMVLKRVHVLLSKEFK